MYFVFFSWWKDFRVPTSTPKVKVATAGIACGVWYEKLNTFQFKLPAGVCAADMSFMGTSGIHEFHFTLDSAQATHVAWEHADYPHTTDAFLLERAFYQVGGKRPQVVDLPLPRVADMTKYHNPTRPAHLKGGALVRRKRSYSPNEFRSVQAVGLEQSPAYFKKGTKTVHRAKSAPHRRYSRERANSREKSPSTYYNRNNRVAPNRRDSRSASRDRSRSRSPSKQPPPVWASKLRCMPMEHTKFLWDIVSYISNLQGFFDFALGCNIPNHTVRRAIEDNDPSDGNVSLDNCVIQALTFWWTSSNMPAVRKSDKIKQGFIKMKMPGVYECIIKRHPTLDPSLVKSTEQQPCTSGQMSPRPRKYVSLESIALQLLSIEYDFLRELSHLIKTPELTYGLVCMTNLPDETYAFIRREHTHFGLSVKEIQSRIAFHVLCIWYMPAKLKFHVIPMLKEMFHDLELADDCEEIIDKFPSVVDKLKTNAYPAEPNKIKMGTKSLGKGKSSKVNSNNTASQSNCSSTHPLHSISENGEESDMEEQVPELVDISDNEISSTKDNNRDNGQGPTTENENERNENEKNKNENSRHTHRPIILMTNLKHLLEK